MKRYLVTLFPENKIPEEGCDSAFDDVRLWVLAEDPEEAKEKAIKVMKKHKLYCKVGFVRGGTETNPKWLSGLAAFRRHMYERRLKK